MKSTANQLAEGGATDDSNKVPFVAGWCYVVSVSSILIGGLILVGAFMDGITKPGFGSYFSTGTALLLSAVLWAAIGKAIVLLDRIAENTAGKSL